MNLQYDIKMFDTATSVHTSPRKMAYIFRNPGPDRTTAKVDVPQYDVDSFHMNQSTIKHMMLDPSAYNMRQYGFNFTSPRWRPATAPSTDREFYNTSALHKQVIADRVVSSPRTYAVMRTTTQRPDPVPTINPDYYRPKNHELSYNLARSERRYSTISLSTPRPDLASVGGVKHGGHYDTDRLHKASVAHEAHRKSFSRAFKAPPRTGMAYKTAAPDRFYDHDTSSLWQHVQKSGNPYHGMHHSSRDGDLRVPPSHHLDYNIQANPIKPSLAHSVLFSPRLLSNVRCATPRFKHEVTTSPHVHAFYDVRRCPKGEGDIAKRVAESTRKYFGGQSTQKRSVETGQSESLNLEYNPSYGKAQSLSSCVEHSPIRFSQMRSSIPRFEQEKTTASMDEYEALLRNPDKIDLKFRIQGNLVVKQTSDRNLVVVGRQTSSVMPAPS